MFIGAGVLALLWFLILWLALGHFWVGVIGAIIILLIGGGIHTGGRGGTYRT